MITTDVMLFSKLAGAKTRRFQLVLRGLPGWKVDELKRRFSSALFPFVVIDDMVEVESPVEDESPALLPEIPGKARTIRSVKKS